MDNHILSFVYFYTVVMQSCNPKTFFNNGDLGKLAKLDIVSARTKMYANSRHNIELNITVDIRATNKEKLYVDETELRPLLYLCDYTTGEKIGSPWNFSDDSNEYTIRFVAASPLSTGPLSTSNELTHIKKYIYSTLDSSTTLIFAVGIDIPGVGPFDTSKNGTSTPNGPNGSVFKSPKSLTIEALRPIDYSLRENITIEGGAFETISSTLGWTSRFSVAGPYASHYNGICKRRLVYIRPNERETGEEKFEKSRVEYEPISNQDVNKDTIKWNTADDVDCFSFLKEEYAKPCAVIGQKKDADGFDLNVWYSGRKTVGIEGPFFVGDASYYYRFSATAYKNHSSEYNKSIPTLVLYKFHVPESNTDKYGWENALRSVSVSVTDFNGNDGKFQLAFNDSDQFDVPGIV